MPKLRETLKHLAENSATLTRDEARAALHEMLAGDASDIEIAALLTLLNTRGETVDELTGFAEAMRSLSVPIPLTDAERAELVDTCGTGGGDRSTFNVSTGAALVAAAAGAKIAKHGNRSVTSQCGSADVLETLGVAIALSPAQSVECLRATGFMFLYSPALHPAMKRVALVRKALGFRTIFNLAGPLTNPAYAPVQVMGVAQYKQLPLAAEAMARLGVRHAFVVRGSDGLDEITVTTDSTLAEVRDGTVALYRTKPEDAGLQTGAYSELTGGDAAANAAVLERIFHGEKGPRRDIVLINAAAALLAAGLAGDLAEGVRLCAHAIDSGAVNRTLESIRAFSRTVQPSA
ncbi:MAG TPA: anthranilate phosphoribosyltransferase [Acidisarcina sp.]|nr:anthranilate phosphoribosyltransferase [Acidisarcina sp.]